MALGQPVIGGSRPARTIRILSDRAGTNAPRSHGSSSRASSYVSRTSTTRSPSSLSLVAAASAVVSSPPVLASSAPRNPRLGRLDRSAAQGGARSPRRPAPPRRTPRPAPSCRCRRSHGRTRREGRPRRATGEGRPFRCHARPATSPARRSAGEWSGSSGDSAPGVNHAATAIEARVTWSGLSRIPKTVEVMFAKFGLVANALKKSLRAKASMA